MASFITYYNIRFQPSAPVLNQVCGCLIAIASRIKAGTAIVGFTDPGNGIAWANKITINDEFVISQAKQCVKTIAENGTIANAVNNAQSPVDSDIEWVIINQVSLATLISTSGA